MLYAPRGIFFSYCNWTLNRLSARECKQFDKNNSKNFSCKNQIFFLQISMVIVNKCEKQERSMCKECNRNQELLPIEMLVDWRFQ